MAQPRETAFQQSSPDSSKGGADSFKFESTPDTRLTAFSPHVSSTKSAKMIKSFSLSASDPQPTRYPLNAVALGTTYRVSDLPGEKDPFVSPITTSQSVKKLSATASDFEPVVSPVVPRASASSGTKASAPSEENFPEYLQSIGIKPILSDDLNLSRYLVVSSPTQSLTTTEVEIYLAVRSSCVMPAWILASLTYTKKLKQFGSACKGTRQTYTSVGQVYVRFSNIRDASMVRRNIRLGGLDWTAAYTSVVDFLHVSHSC